MTKKTIRHPVAGEEFMRATDIFVALEENGSHTFHDRLVEMTKYAASAVKYATYLRTYGMPCYGIPGRGESISDRLTRIEAQKDDDEEALWLQGSLYENVLKAIAEGADNAAELASEALKVLDIDFYRWHA